MGALLSCCLKAGFEDLGMGSLKTKTTRQQTLQQQLADKENSAVDGRKHAVMPDRLTSNSPPLESPNRGYQGFGAFGTTTGASSPGYQQCAGGSPSSPRPERPQPPRRIPLSQPVWGSSEQNYQ
jgi:hypothetical protein